MNVNDETKIEDYITPSATRKYCTYSLSSLRIWANEGKIRTIRSPGGKRYYYLPDIKSLCSTKSIKKQLATICYARSSSKEELNERIKFFKENYPEAEIITEITEIGEIKDCDRKRFQYILEKVSSGTLQRLVVTEKREIYGDGIELLEYILREHNVELLVLVH